ncbi:FMN-binding negative transcriptional regulator (plasmid) [Pseudomonas luteola]|uniref:FMN-binding negative transcriptional regulator n=1 Tax=Pseudomonas luteola TaxID=47886 RepID=UPI00388D9841
MYLPPPFKETDPAVLHRFVKEHPLGALVIQGSHGLSAEHLPFLLESEETGLGILKAHVARASQLWQEALNGHDETLVIFQGPSAYISPSWYASKLETHRVVPTYNYATVHAYGRIKVRDDAQWVRGLVARLTRAHEATQDTPWRMTDAPADFIDEQLSRIVGIEIHVSRLEGKWKMSQNRSEADRKGVLQGLHRESTPQATEAAAEMLRTSPE